MMIVLGETAEHRAGRYNAILERIAFDPTRFNELTDDELVFCRDIVHADVLWLTAQIQAFDTTDAEREAAIARTLTLATATLERQASLATLRLARGLPQTLRDLSTLWVQQRAVLRHFEVASERKAAAMH